MIIAKNDEEKEKQDMEDRNYRFVCFDRNHRNISSYQDSLQQIRWKANG